MPSKVFSAAIVGLDAQIIEVEAGDGAVVVQKVKEGSGEFGFNAATMVYENLIQAGVVDPTKVVRTALENAVSAASMLLTTEALIADLPKKEDGHNHMPSPMMGGDY